MHGRARAMRCTCHAMGMPRDAFAHVLGHLLEYGWQVDHELWAHEAACP